MHSKNLLADLLESIDVKINGDRPWDIRVHDTRFYDRLFVEPSVGAGESYMEGWWDCDRLDELFLRICRCDLDQKLYHKWHIIWRVFVNKTFNLQTRRRSIDVADKHYNLGNEFYRNMLGPSMAYTCAYWKNAQNLDQAQNDKFDLVCRKVNLVAGDRVLDLGCGWGGLAKFMAEKYGCEVVAANISTEQVHYGREICKGLPVTFHLCDYRDSQIYNPNKKRFDKIVSVGLCEHVGFKNYHHFLKVAHHNLKEDGLFLLHTIGKNNSAAYVDPWINKYIFPNGMLPSVKLLSQAMENLFVLEDLHNFGADYDTTLMAWHQNFLKHWPDKHLKIQDQERFFRLWSYYLLTCAGSFRARAMQLWQMVLSPKGVLGGYTSIR